VHVCEMEISMKTTQGESLGPKFVDKKRFCFPNDQEWTARAVLKNNSDASLLSPDADGLECRASNDGAWWVWLVGRAVGR
jgi:hypothetical protein